MSLGVILLKLQADLNEVSLYWKQHEAYIFMRWFLHENANVEPSSYSTAANNAARGFRQSAKDKKKLESSSNIDNMEICKMNVGECRINMYVTSAVAYICFDY